MPFWLIVKAYDISRRYIKPTQWKGLERLGSAVRSVRNICLGEGGNEYLVEGEEMRNIFVWEKYWELLL